MTKKVLMTVICLTLTTAAQAQQSDAEMQAQVAELIASVEASKLVQDSIDVSSLVAVYDYSCRTKDADGKAVTDGMKLCVQVGRHCTRSYPYRKFREDTAGEDIWSDSGLVLLKKESYCYMPEVWTNYPDDQTTVRDAIIPMIYEAREKRKPIQWELMDAGEATCLLHGRRWTVRYDEDIPTTAGPWKLCGLPGLIVEATSEDSIHHFALADLQHVATPIYYEHSAITTNISEQKLIKDRIKIFGNKRYPKTPSYYMPDLGTMNVNDVYCEIEGESYLMINWVLELKEAHVFQPLEKE